jgi:hypothetical protein
LAGSTTYARSVVPLVGLGFGLRHLAHGHPALTAVLLVVLIGALVLSDRRRRRR